MEERILELALAVSGAGEAERGLLELLCEAAAEQWRRRLREGVTPQGCGAAFLCAAAFTAAAGLTAGRSGGAVAGFTAGNLSIQTRDGESGGASAAQLRQAAEEIMAPYAAAGDFCFKGVRG